MQKLLTVICSIAENVLVFQQDNGPTRRLMTFWPSFCAVRQTPFIMVALCRPNRADHYIFMLFLSSSFFFSSPNLSGRRLDVYHTSAHGVALVRI